jgi:hypothetical protein
MSLRYKQLGFQSDSVRGLRVTNPLRILFLTLLLTVLSLGTLYVVVGCDTDWAVQVGLLLDILGAVGLGILEFPRLGGHCYARRLRKFHHELLGEGAPPLTPRRETFLQDVFKDLPSDPEFTIEHGELLVKSRDDPTDPGDSFSLEVVQRRLDSLASDESDRLKQVAVSLLIGGFSLQLLGNFIESRALLGLLNMFFQFVGLPISSC